MGALCCASPLSESQLCSRAPPRTDAAQGRRGCVSPAPRLPGGVVCSRSCDQRDRGRRHEIGGRDAPRAPPSRPPCEGSPGAAPGWGRARGTRSPCVLCNAHEDQVRCMAEAPSPGSDVSVPARRRPGSRLVQGACELATSSRWAAPGPASASADCAAHAEEGTDVTERAGPARWAGPSCPGVLRGQQPPWPTQSLGRVSPPGRVPFPVLLEPSEAGPWPRC